MIGLIIVSHSEKLADGLLQLAEQMQNSQYCQIRIAAGIDDIQHPIGTDAIRVLDAIESLNDASDIILLMDLGSAILSAETALDLIETELAQKVHLCSAPLVEGTIAITASASSGAPLQTILQEAQNSLQAKQLQLNDVSPPPPSTASHIETTHNALRYDCILQNQSGLHTRPAAKIASTLGVFNATLQLKNNDKIADAKSMNQIALLQARQGDKVTLIADGQDAQAAIDAFHLLAKQHFGDDVCIDSGYVLQGKNTFTPNVSGIAYHHTPDEIFTATAASTDIKEMQKITVALQQLQKNLSVIAKLVAEKYGQSLADIFHGHRLLLDDDEIIQNLQHYIQMNNCDALSAIKAIFSEMSAQYQQLEDPYLNARFIDIEDLKNQLMMITAEKPLKKRTFSEPTVLLCRNLGPIELMQLNQPSLCAIALAQGSPYSHTAIIAKKMGIPMLVELGEMINDIPPQRKLTMSIEQGTLSISTI